MSVKTEKDVLDIIQTALKLEEEVDLNTQMSDVEAWDSLGHLSILAALDKSFEGKVASITDIAMADSVKSIMNVLKANSLIKK